LRQTEDTGDQDEIKGESSAQECNRKELQEKEDSDDIGDELSEYQDEGPDPCCQTFRWSLSRWK